MIVLGVVAVSGIKPKFEVLKSLVKVLVSAISKRLSSDQTAPLPTVNFNSFKKSIFYNINSIIGKDECFIVEGEFDVLAMYECGYKNTISVPNGANDNATGTSAVIQIAGA